MRPKVFITRNLPGNALERVKSVCDVDIFNDDIPPSRQELLDRTKNKDGLLTLLTDRVDKELLDTAPNLRVISNYAVGFDNIDIEEASRRKIPVGNTPSVLTETTADLAFALLAAGARRIIEGNELCRSGDFRAWSPSLLLGWDLYGSTLGIIGMGRIGQAVARRARGFSMNVIYCSSNHSQGTEIEEATRVSFDELIRCSDFISLHVPLNDSTRKIINSKTLSAMKPSAVLVNTARGGCVDNDALYYALKNKIISAAALDVTEPEPLPCNHRLFDLPNCLIIPHIGSGSYATRSTMAHMAVDNLLSGLNNERLPYCVNTNVYTTPKLNM